MWTRVYIYNTRGRNVRVTEITEIYFIRITCHERQTRVKRKLTVRSGTNVCEGVEIFRDFSRRNDVDSLHFRWLEYHFTALGNKRATLLDPETRSPPKCSEIYVVCGLSLLPTELPFSLSISLSLSIYLSIYPKL